MVPGRGVELCVSSRHALGQVPTTDLIKPCARSVIIKRSQTGLRFLWGFFTLYILDRKSVV